MGNEVAKGALGALFHDDIAKVLLLNDIVSLDYVRVVNCGEGFLFSLQQVFGDFIVDLTHVDCLDSNRFISFYMTSWVREY